MCLIIYKPQYTKMPPDKYIVNGYNNNANGFGLAYWGQGMDAVRIQKGAMSIKRVFKMIDSIPDAYQKAVVLHFRFATNGDVCPGNCHPFPISSKVSELRALSIDTKRAVAHNGIILDFTRKTGLKNYQWNSATQHYEPKESSELDELSDTMEFIIDYLVDCGKAIYNHGVKKMIEAFTESKFVVLATGGRVEFIGDFVKEDGIFYSNQSFRLENYYVVPSMAANTPTVLRYDRKTKTWVNPKYYPDADFGETTPIARYGSCEVCGEWGKLEYYKEGGALMCPDCIAYYNNVYTRTGNYD